MKALHLLLPLTILPSHSLQIHRPHNTQQWCQSVISPKWPFAYSKYSNQTEETKGRTSTNLQDVRHECETRGVRSKCHVCEDVQCENGTCHFQLQGVKSEEMSVNIPTVSDVPWAVGGAHRYDFGGPTTSHVCMYLSSKAPCQSSFGQDYSGCELRCWGYGMTGLNVTVTSVTRMEGDPDGRWPNHHLDSFHGVNSTPWMEPEPTIAWEYPKFGEGNAVPRNPVGRENYSFNPQGFVFTLAGSDAGEEGFVDGVEADARFRRPDGVAVDHDGYVYVADTGNHAIRMISPSGKVQTLAGTGTPGHMDGLASDGVQFSSPTDIAVWRDWAWWPYENPIDPNSFLYRNGNGTLALFVADTDNHRIRKISGTILYDKNGDKTWKDVVVECFSGRCGFGPEPGYADGEKDNTRFDSPQGLTVSDNGRVFVADTNNHAIREIDRFGKTKTIAGSTRVAEIKRNGLEVEGCPEPCLSGDPGDADGSSKDAHFIYPSDVALDSDNTAVFVTDRHHIRRLDLDEQTVTTLAGGGNEGERDGLGSEATLNNPGSITVTADGAIYIADSTSCRVRRVSSPEDFVPEASCHDTLASIIKPNGCSSYNVPSDDDGMTASPVEGNIHYNYLYRHEYEPDLGHDYIGRTVKNCVGSPPTALLDKKSWNDTVTEYPYNYNLVVDDVKRRVREDPNDGTRITVACLAGCSTDDPELDDMIDIELPGIASTTFYGEATPVCAAARNDDILSEVGTGLIDVTIVSEDTLARFVVDGALRSRQYFFVSASSREMRVQTIAGAPTGLRGQSCGYLDSFPPQSSKFWHPTGLAAFANASVDDSTRFMFIADRDNNIIRGMSAVCTFRCENGGLCVEPDKCECSEGWSGNDCTQPLCENACSSRELCVAPNTCACIPGFGGEGCLSALCVQKCENGGRCSAPDTCTCSPGWFDSNCTTPICEQTCGNGGNCTGSNICTCPSDWRGEDCRTPVCEQNCGNGGVCVAPNTCLCPPSWSGYDCSLPVCHQGFFVPHHQLPETRKSNAKPSHWAEYRPCNYSAWCNETSGFDCAQKEQSFSTDTPQFGEDWRHKTGRKEQPDECMMIELQKDAITHFQYISSKDNSSSPHYRYSRTQPYDWLSNVRLPWNAFDQPQAGITQPYTYEIDRQIALVAYAVNVAQGAYMCANGGACVSPEVCSCESGWIGFDCRVPVCEQGYYEPKLHAFASNVETDNDFATFKRFLDSRRPYDLDSSHQFSSNPDVQVQVEHFINVSSLERKLTIMNGSRYLTNDADSRYQGGYECSIRSVSQWERAGFVFDHPNYYSRYMDEKIEADGSVYSDWKGMHYPPTHHKTAKLIKYGDEYVNSTALSATNVSFIYTDKGHIVDGVWKVTGAQWEKGVCVVEFERRCEGSFEHINPNDVVDEISGVLVQDTDESYRPRILYDDKRCYISGRWFVSKNEVCVDRVIRGCFNNGTCIAPNTCECAPGWSGYDCSMPVCDQTCLHNGNCTHPHTCTCERGWSGDDCSVAQCAQECKNGGKCVAPDTCQCAQWDNLWRDGSVGGGIPIYQKPNGDPQLTGWTGYDCSTPICVQAERFRLNVDSKSAKLSDIVPLGGSKSGEPECNKVRCPENDEMLTQNDGRSFQSGCGWDVFETGCCFELESGAFTCYRCLDLEIGDSNATCSQDSLHEWHYGDMNNVPLTFRRRGEVTLCGPALSPAISTVDSVKSNVTVTSNVFLCNVFQWEQGDYIDDAGLSQVESIGADFGLKGGRHIRVNYNNYQRSKTNINVWINGPEIAGEGIFECYNFGSCILPDTCSCRDGYGGFDCRTPLCRHQQESGEVVGCLNGGICIEKDTCQCIQIESLLWKKHSGVERGLTGWTGTDCSMPMCIQGFFDPDCNATENAPGQEGCYRCANGGLCVSPDKCLCADGWTGYDCRIPVCKAEATEVIRKQLMTSDPRKIAIFENDPCGMKGFHSLRDDGPRGVCAMPNQCTCVCRASYNENLCYKLGGEYCKTPFHDPLFRRRNVLAPNEVFGTRDCYSGFEGLVDENDMFGSCHLTIYEPSIFNRYTVLLVGTIIIAFIFVCILLGCIWVKLTRRRTVQRKRLQRVKSKKDTRTVHSFAFDSGRRKYE